MESNNNTTRTNRTPPSPTAPTQAQLLAARSDRNSSEERHTGVSLELQSKSDELVHVKAQLRDALERGNAASAELDRSKFTLTSQLEDARDELRGARIALDEEQQRSIRNEKRSAGLETQVSAREERIVELENLQRDALKHIREVEEKAKAQVETAKEGYEAARLKIKQEQQTTADADHTEIADLKAEIVRLLDREKHLKEEAALKASGFEAELRKWEEAERSWHAREVEVREEHNAAKVELARCEERLRTTEEARVAARKMVEVMKDDAATEATQVRERTATLEDELAETKAQTESLRSAENEEALKYKLKYKQDVSKLRKIAHRAVAERDAAVAEKVKVLDETKEHSANENGMRQQLVDEVVKLQTELAVTKSELEAMRDELKVQESSIDHAKFLAEINGQMKDVEMSGYIDEEIQQALQRFAPSSPTSPSARSQGQGEAFFGRGSGKEEGEEAPLAPPEESETARGADRPARKSRRELEREWEDEKARRQEPRGERRRRGGQEREREPTRGLLVPEALQPTEPEEDVSEAVAHERRRVEQARRKAQASAEASASGRGTGARPGARAGEGAKGRRGEGRVGSGTAGKRRAHHTDRDSDPDEENLNYLSLVAENGLPNPVDHGLFGELGVGGRAVLGGQFWVTPAPPRVERPPHAEGTDRRQLTPPHPPPDPRLEESDGGMAWSVPWKKPRGRPGTSEIPVVLEDQPWFHDHYRTRSRG